MMLMTSLTEREKKRIMKELMDKYNKETLEKEEAIRLRSLLQEKQEQALDTGAKF